MTDDNQDLFVINRLRRTPVEYSVTISHYVEDGKWVMGISIHGVSEPDEMQRERVAADLRHAAKLVEGAEWETQNDG